MNIFSIYTQLVYSLPVQKLQECYDTLLMIYKFICQNINILYENVELNNNIVKEFVFNILGYIKIYRHDNYILNILKYCMNLISNQIRFYKLQIYDTKCGKIIIMGNNMYDCSLHRYIRIIYNSYLEQIE